MMTRPAILVGHVKLPVELLGQGLPTLAKMQRQLTYRYQPMGAEVALKLPAWFMDRDYICVPRQYGIRLCNQFQIELLDETSTGAKAKFPRVPTPRDYQAETLDLIDEEFRYEYDVLFRAHTGWGKTIGALITAARNGTSVLIVVDQDNLKDQWIERLTDPNLFGFSKEDIGVVQSDKCIYKGKAVTLGMVQTLTQREYPKEFYSYFGMLIGDEVHTLGAPTFSQILFDFPATKRLFVSATPKRKDGLQKALDDHCGPVRVAADQQHDESAVYVLRNPTVYSWYANISPKVGRIITEVAEDATRNLLVVDAAMWLVESGRPTVILSDRTSHLQELRSLLIYMGVDENEVGLYTDKEPVIYFGKDPAPEKQPANLHRWVDASGKRVFAPYCAVALQVKDKKVPKKRLEWVKENCSYILATFGKFAKGMDVPRLAGGVDATPRSSAEQAHGRILRKLDGKLKPIWVTIVDDGSYRLLHSFAGRIKDYLNSNACFYEWDGSERIVKWNAQQLQQEVGYRREELRPMKIIENKRTGEFVLCDPATVRQNEAQQMKARLLKQPSHGRTLSNAVASNAKSRATEAQSSPRPTPLRRRPKRLGRTS